MRFDDINRAMSIRSEIERQRQMVASVQTQRILAEQARQERLLDDLTRLTSLPTPPDLHLKVSDLLFSPTYIQIGLQTKMLVRLMERPELLAALGGLSGVPNVLIEQARQYRDALRDEVAGEAVAEDDSVPTPDVLARLAEERQAILVCLKRFAAIVVAANYIGIYRLPNIVLGLIVAFIAIGEVADEMIGEHYDDAA